MVTFITNLGVFLFDATFETTVNTSVELPSYPTESGVRVNDHRIIQPTIYRVFGAVSEVPLGFMAYNDLLSKFSPKSFASYKHLQLILNNAQPFIVTDGTIIMKNMLITDIDLTQDTTTQGAYFFDIALQEFITLDRLPNSGEPSDDVLPDNDPVKSGASASVKQGDVAPVNTPNTQQINEVLDSI